MRPPHSKQQTGNGMTKHQKIISTATYDQEPYNFFQVSLTEYITYNQRAICCKKITKLRVYIRRFPPH